MGLSKVRLFVEAVAFLGLLHFSHSGSCPAEYERFSATHTICKTPNLQCHADEGGVNKVDMEKILDKHNSLRRSVAQGRKKDVDLPDAANMVKLVYDEELEKIAQKHADQCIFKHDCDECRQSKQYHVGQNIYEMWTTQDLDKIGRNWTQAIQKWYEEIKYFVPSDVKKFSEKGLEKIGHLTQLLWGKTHRIGCGFVEFPKVIDGTRWTYQIYVCNYGPGGNVIGEPMYKIGQACSKCPPNAGCDKGLCTLDDREPTPEPPTGAISYCTFRGENKCDIETSGSANWKLVDTYSGSFKEVVLNKGQSTTLTFLNVFKANGDGNACVKLTYRKGPDNAVAGPASNKAKAKFILSDHDFETDLNDNDADFSTLEVTLHKQPSIKVVVTFSALKDAVPQFMNVKDVAVYGKDCPSLDNE